MNNSISNLFLKTFNRNTGGNGATPRIRGTLLTNDGNHIKLSIGNNSVLDIRLRERIAGEPGKTVTIDKRNIISSHILNSINPKLDASEDRFTQILKALNMPIKSEFIETIKALDFYGIHVSKDNIMDFIATKDQIDYIINNLDYETVANLQDKDIDIEKASMDEVVEALKELHNEKEEGLSIRKILKSINQLTTEDAENISKKIYGSSMGKDIYDIIKALHQTGSPITKNNIDKINRVFHKLNHVKDIEADKIIEVSKNKVEVSIDDLYKSKRNIVKSGIEGDSRLSYGTQYYEAISLDKKVTDKQLKLLEEDIKVLLEASGIDANEESVKLSKLMIKNSMDLTAANIEKITALKEAIKDIAALLDYEKVAVLLQQGVNIEKEAVQRLVEILRSMNTNDATSLPSMDSKETIERMVDKITELPKLSDEDLINLLKNNSSIKLKDIMLGDKVAGNDKPMEDKLYTVYNMIHTFNHIKSLDYSSIALHLSRNIPISLHSIDGFYKEAAKGNIEIGKDSSAKVDLTKALIKHNLAVNSLNLEKMQTIQNQYSIIRNNLSLSMVKAGLDKGIQMDKLPLDSLMEHVKAPMKAPEIKTANLGNQKESIIGLLMKNNLTSNLMTINNLSMMLKNKEQLGHQLQQLNQLLDSSENLELRKASSEIKTLVGKLHEEMKAANPDISKFNEETIKLLRDLINKEDKISGGIKDSIEKQVEKLLNNYQLQGQINKTSSFLQIPMLNNNHIHNLQIFVMNKKGRGKKIDPENMSVLLNIDTNHMDNINMYIGVSGKKIIIKAVVLEEQYLNEIQKELKGLEELISAVGYQVREVTLKVDGNQSLFNLAEEEEINDLKSSSFIDITI